MKTPCPRCGAREKTHEVKTQVRRGGYSANIRGASVGVCEPCAVELRDELAAVIERARIGVGR